MDGFVLGFDVRALAAGAGADAAHPSEVRVEIREEHLGKHAGLNRGWRRLDVRAAAAAADAAH